MPGPQRQLLNQDKICRKVKKKSDFEEGKMMRKIRVLYNDPDATDSSSEDEDYTEIKARKKNGLDSLKRLVLEIHLPVPSAETENSFHDNGNSKNPTRVLQRSFKSSSKIKGARPRRLSQIQDPPGHVWLDSLETHETDSSDKINAPSESSMAVAAASSSCVSDDSETLFSPSSPASVLDISPSTTSMVDGCLTSLNDERDSVKVAEPVKDFLEEPFFDFDPLLIEEFGQVFDDFVGLDNIPLYDFGEQENNFSGFDFDLDPEAVAWMNL